MIEVINVNKRFGKLKVLQDFSIKLDMGKVVCVIGPNGSGKTTFIKCLLGMVIPDSGQIMISGNSIIGTTEYRRKIGYMPQIGRYPENMTIGQVIDMMRDFRKDSVDCDEDLIEQYNLKGMFDKSMHTLSGGTTQKVSAALAFLFKPDVLVLDEPTAGLDPIAAETLKHKIKMAKESGRLVIISSHILSEIDEMADEIIYVQEGRPKFHKSLEEIKSLSGEEKLGKAIANLIA